MRTTDTEYIRPAAAARAVGMDRSNLYKAIQRGLIPSRDGLVRLADVKAYRASIATRVMPRPRRASVSADGLINIRELLQMQSSDTEADLLDTPGDRVALTAFFGHTVARADAEALLTAYRGGKANLPAVRELHKRLGLDRVVPPVD